MDIVKAKLKKNPIVKAWRRCKSSISSSSTRSPSFNYYLKRSFTTHDYESQHKRKGAINTQVAPYGCFSVYVGPEKQRFVVRAEFANHPLFKMLLEDAELEYGYNSEGPILLPCDVDLFYKVLAELESGDDDFMGTSPSCNLILCSPNNIGVGYKYGGYKLLSPSRMLKFNQF